VKRVALYYPWIYVRSGVERVILEIMRRSRHRYTVFTHHLNPSQTYPEFRDLPVVVLAHVPVERSFGAVLRAARTIVMQKLDLRGYDALLVSSEGLGDLITFRNHDQLVFCFCHTPARPVYDPVYRATWLAAHPLGRIPLAVFSLAYHAVTRRAWRYYQRVFANSCEVAGRIARGRLCPPERVEVLHPGVDVDRIRPSFRYEPYFLCAGRIKWTKNVALAIDSFHEFQRGCRDGAGWRLVIAGGLDAGSREYFAELERRARKAPGVTFRLDPTTEELDRLYDGATAVVFPSLNEDWGIVPLEAMAFGKPVLAVNRGGPTESVVDGETGFLLEPTAAAFAERMRWLAERPEELRRFGQAAAQRARQYSWTAFVERLDDYIDSGAPAA
jgi:glycosyltransferase involved in cell wall biosynthesis